MCDERRPRLTSSRSDLLPSYGVLSHIGNALKYSLICSLGLSGRKLDEAYSCSQVQAQLRKGNADMAKATLEKEKLLKELRNQIAIIRCAALGH